MQFVAERGYSTPLSNSTLLPLLLLSLSRQKHTPDTSNTFENEYDYVIVGAGSAGSVVASRLSELPCVKVLLLEAGPKPPLLTELPALGRYLWDSNVSWRYKSVPQKYTGEGLVNKEMPWTSGKMLGGSSSLNSHIYVRGNMKNFDDWERLGATGWSFKDVFHYFLKMEDNRDPEYLFNGYHTFGGPISVERPNYRTDLQRATYEAATSLGYEVLDPNAARQTGFYDFQATNRDSQRCSTAKAYLVPVENRTNLDILPNAMVTKVIMKGNQATGVQFHFAGQSFEVQARKEVILSAGAINTPQILKLSGIGPKRELRILDIQLVVDLPGVGDNLQNHAGISYHFVLNSSIPNFDAKISDALNINEYIENRAGPLCSTDGYYYVAFLKGLSASSLGDFPNYELYITETSTSLLKGSGLKPEVYQQLYGPYENQAIFTCTIQQVQAKSRGTVTLRSKNPYDSPLIDPNYLADPRDMEDLVQGLKFCRRLISSEPFRNLGATPLQTLIPGCQAYINNEDEYFRCQVRTLLFTFHHPSSTAKMGNPLDLTTVVDPELKVKNINNLRIVDASVMPLITSGNTNIPTIMIAEKASDKIKQTINCFVRTEEVNMSNVLLSDIPRTLSILMLCWFIYGY